MINQFAKIIPFIDSNGRLYNMELNEYNVLDVKKDQSGNPELSNPARYLKYGEIGIIYDNKQIVININNEGEVDLEEVGKNPKTETKTFVFRITEDRRDTDFFRGATANLPKDAVVNSIIISISEPIYGDILQEDLYLYCGVALGHDNGSGEVETKYFNKFRATDEDNVSETDPKVSYEILNIEPVNIIRIRFGNESGDLPGGFHMGYCTVTINITYLS